MAKKNNRVRKSALIWLKESGIKAQWSCVIDEVLRRLTESTPSRQAAVSAQKYINARKRDTARSR